MIRLRWIVLLALIVFGLSQNSFAADSRDALIDAQMKTGGNASAEQDMTLTDGIGHVYKIQGKVLIAKSGSPVEKKLKVGDSVQKGDRIHTYKKASVSIAFDYLKQNAVHIPESSRATFVSIEPTDIKLENGTVFSAVDGLAYGSTWKVTTPVAVAAVRGTLFLVRFETATGEFYAATVDIPDDGKTSAVEIAIIDRDGSANVPEGKEITLREGETPSSEMVQDLSPEMVTEIQQFFEQLVNDRQDTSQDMLGEFTAENHFQSTEPPTMDSLPKLDPLEDFKDQHGQKQIEEQRDEELNQDDGAGKYINGDVS